MRRRWPLALLGVGVAACGHEGTLSLSLIFPPGETRLPAGAITAQLTVTAPNRDPVVTTSPIAADGSFDVVVATDATGASAQVTLDALDAQGVSLARGLSPRLALAAVDETVRLFMAPPRRFVAAPVALPEARAEVALAYLSYGVAFAGGRTADGQRSDHVEIYSVFTHALYPGAPLPAARARLAAAGGALDQVYLFGGIGTGEAPASDAWRFDTTFAPNGRTIALTSSAAYARAGAAVAPLSSFTFLVTGSPPLILDTRAGGVTAFQNASAAAAQATAATTQSARAVILTGPGGVVAYDPVADTFTTLAPDARTEQAQAYLGPDVLAIGGLDASSQLLASALRVTPTGAVATIPLLARARRQAAAAVTGRVLVVAGGFDASGAALDDAELFDATTLAPMGAVPLVVPRGGAAAMTLTNGLVVLASGRASDPAGAPTAVVEIFTP